MKSSKETGDIDKAMLAAQIVIEPARESAYNTFHKSHYADMGDVIAAVKGPLNANGIVIMQAQEQDENGVYVETWLKHAASGQFYMSQTPVAVSKPNDAQALKSGGTYAKRTGLEDMICLSSEDDDGASASKSPAKKNVIHKKKITADDMKTDDRTKYIQGFDTAELAIAAIQNQYTIDAAGIQHIRDEHAKKAV